MTYKMFWRFFLKVDFHLKMSSIIFAAPPPASPVIMATAITPKKI